MAEQINNITPQLLEMGYTIDEVREAAHEQYQQLRGMGYSEQETTAAIQKRFDFDFSDQSKATALTMANESIGAKMPNDETYAKEAQDSMRRNIDVRANDMYQSKLQQEMGTAEKDKARYDAKIEAAAQVAAEPESAWDKFQAWLPRVKEPMAYGYGSSIVGLSSGAYIKDPPKGMSTVENLFAFAGQIIGDAPTLVVGHTGGTALAAGSGPAAPFIGAMAAMGLTEASRAGLMAHQERGSIQNASELLYRAKAISGGALTGAALGGAGAAGGALAGKALTSVPYTTQWMAAQKAAGEMIAASGGKLTAGMLAEQVGTVAGEAAGFMTMDSIANKRMPTLAEFAHGAMLISGMRGYGVAKAKLIEAYKATGVRPGQLLDYMAQQKNAILDIMSLTAMRPKDLKSGDYMPVYFIYRNGARRNDVGSKYNAEHGWVYTSKPMAETARDDINAKHQVIDPEHNDYFNTEMRALPRNAVPLHVREVGARREIARQYLLRAEAEPTDPAERAKTPTPEEIAYEADRQFKNPSDEFRRWLAAGRFRDPSKTAGQPNDKYDVVIFDLNEQNSKLLVLNKDLLAGQDKLTQLQEGQDPSKHPLDIVSNVISTGSEPTSWAKIRAKGKQLAQSTYARLFDRVSALNVGAEAGKNRPSYFAARLLSGVQGVIEHWFEYGPVQFTEMTAKDFDARRFDRADLNALHNDKVNAEMVAYDKAIVETMNAPVLSLEEKNALYQPLREELESIKQVAQRKAVTASEKLEKENATKRLGELQDELSKLPYTEEERFAAVEELRTQKEATRAQMQKDAPSKSLKAILTGVADIDHSIPESAHSAVNAIIESIKKNSETDFAQDIEQLKSLLNEQKQADIEQWKSEHPPELATSQITSALKTLTDFASLHKKAFDLIVKRFEKLTLASGRAGKGADGSAISKHEAMKQHGIVANALDNSLEALIYANAFGQATPREIAKQMEMATDVIYDAFRKTGILDLQHDAWRHLQGMNIQLRSSLDSAQGKAALQRMLTGLFEGSAKSWKSNVDVFVKSYKDYIDTYAKRGEELKRLQAKVGGFTSHQYAIAEGVRATSESIKGLLDDIARKQQPTPSQLDALLEHINNLSKLGVHKVGPVDPSLNFGNVHEVLNALSSDKQLQEALERHAQGYTAEELKAFELSKSVENEQVVKQFATQLKDMLQTQSQGYSGTFKAFVTARHLYSQAQAGKVTGVPMSDLQAVAEDPVLLKRYGQAAAELYQYQRELLRVQRAAGLISHDTYNKILAENPYYVPIERLQSIEGVTTAESKIIDPIESLIKATYDTIYRAESNQVTRLVAEEFGLIKGGPESFGQSKTVAEWQAAKASEQNIFRNRTIKWKEDGKEREADVARDVFDAVMNIGPATGLPGKEFVSSILARVADLNRQGITLDPVFAIKNLWRDQLTAMVQAEGGSVPFYDMARGMAGMFAAKHGMKIFPELQEHYKSWLRNGGAYSNYLASSRKYNQKVVRELTEGHDLHGSVPATENGARSILGYIGQLQRSIGGRLRQTAKDPVGMAGRALATPFDAARRLGSYMEEATRVGVHIRAREKGFTGMEAAFAAREATIDFNRMGSSMKALNAIIPFFNAQLQGADKFFRVWQAHPVRTAMRVGVGIVIPSMMLEMVNRSWTRANGPEEEQKYNERPQWIKDLYYTFYLGKEYPMLRIPKPQEYGVSFGTMAENFVGHLYDNSDKDWFGEYLASSGFAAARDQFGLSAQSMFNKMMAQPARPLIEVAVNYNMFTGHPILSQAMQERLPADRYRPRTTEASKAIGQLLEQLDLGQRDPFTQKFASPVVIDYLVKEYAGTLGQRLLNLTSSLGEKAGVFAKKNMPERNWESWPLIESFTIEYPTMSAASIDEFKEAYLYNMQKLNSFKDRIKTGAYDAWTPEQMTVVESGLLNLSKHEDAIRKMGAALRQLYYDPDMDPVEKRQRETAIIFDAIAIAKDGLERVKEMEREQAAARKKYELAH